MSIDKWENLGEMGAVYPGQGTEVILVIVGVIFWIGWHVIQARGEARQHKEEIALYKDKLDDILDDS